MEVLILSLQEINLNDMPILGKPFLSSAYLLVDYDHNEYSLWKSNPAASQNLVALGPSTCRNSTSTAGGSPTSSVPHPTSPIPDPTSVNIPPRSSKANPSKKIVASASVGTVAFTVVSLWLLLLLKRYLARQRTQPPPKQDEIPSSGTDGPRNESSICFQKPELASDRHPPQEMPLRPNDLGPHELSSSHNIAFEMPS